MEKIGLSKPCVVLPIILVFFSLTVFAQDIDKKNEAGPGDSRACSSGLKSCLDSAKNNMASAVSRRLPR